MWKVKLLSDRSDIIKLYSLVRNNFMDTVQLIIFRYVVAYKMVLPFGFELNIDGTAVRYQLHAYLLDMHNSQFNTKNPQEYCDNLHIIF